MTLKDEEKIQYAINRLEATHIDFTLVNDHFYCQRKSDNKLIQFWAETGKIQGYDNLYGIHNLIRILLS